MERTGSLMCGLAKRRPFHDLKLFKLGPSLLIGVATYSRRTGEADGNQTSSLKAHRR